MPEFEEQEINLREYFLVIIKRRWMILTIILFIMTVSGIYSFLQTPLFQARTSMYIDRLNYNIVPEVVTDSYTWESYENFFQTQYKLLKSKTLAKRVVDRLNLSAADLARPGEQKPRVQPARTPDQVETQKSALAGSLLGMIDIVPIKNTTLVEIVATSPNPKFAMILANAWSEEYVDYSLASQYEYTQKAEELLTSQVKSLQSEIAEGEKELQDYSLQKQVVKLDNERSMSSHTLEEFNSGLTEATKNRISKEVHYNDLRTHGKEAVPEVNSNATVQQLKQQYADLQRQYSDKSKTYKPDYPEMVRLKSQIDQVKLRLDAEEDDAYSKVLAAANAEYAEASNQERALQKNMDDAKRDSIALGQKELNYDKLKLEIDNKKALLESLLKKQSETDVSVQVKEKKATTIRIVDRAELPGSPYTPNVRRSLWFALIMGLIVGIGCAFLLEYLDSSLKSSEDVERHVQLPFLGIVPRYMTGESESENGSRNKELVKQDVQTSSPSEAVDLLTFYNPTSVASEAFKTVRTSLLLSFPETPPRTILITSSRPGEGKTFVACNLAISLAQLDKKVVLVDADMRNPRVHRIWGLRNDVGLSRFLTSDAKVQEVIRPSKVKGLSLITSGAKTPRPAELLSSHRLKALLEQLQGEYDHIIIDSPPLMPVTDAVILAAKSSCVLMVVHGGVTPRDVVQMAKQKLMKSDATMAGVVLNYIDLTDPYYYYSYYSRYYSYRYGESQKALPPKFIQ
jgi:polysaccharide biosynthesis transport protein